METLLTGRITSESVLSTETRTQGTLLERVHKSVRRTEEGLEDNPHAADQLGQEQGLRGLVQGRGTLTGSVASRKVILGELFTVGAVVVSVDSAVNRGDVNGTGHCWGKDTGLCYQV